MGIEADARRRAWERLAARAKATGDSTYEVQFVERVLTHVPGLDPERVSPQRTFRTAYNRVYRVDFTIEDGNVRIAVEVDGWDKTGRGTGMTRAEYDAWVAREGDLRALGWTLFRTTNSEFMRDPLRVAEMLGEVLRLQRQVMNPETPPRGSETRFPVATPPLPRGGFTIGPLAAFVAIGIVVAIGLVLLSRSASPPPGATASTLQVAARSASPVPGSAPRACPSAYPIKGNVTQSGSVTNRIYHVPGGNFYAATNPETCFATETEAQAAGFRRSSN